MCLMLNGKACTTAWAGPKCNKALTGGRNRAVTARQKCQRDSSSVVTAGGDVLYHL